MNNPCSITICICTFRREHIVATLESLALSTQIPPSWTINVVVADNDDTPSAQDMVLETSHRIPFPITYIHAPARNISVARNACLHAAQGDYIAFIDDDETVTPLWLHNLVTACQTDNADAVLGPVNAMYPASAPTWIQKGDFHTTRPVWVNGDIITGYACNLLLKRMSPALGGLEFRTDLGQTGGEDTAFLSGLHHNGGYIVYAADALVLEPVPPSRLSWKWLAKRRFRSGQTHALLIMEKHGAAAALRMIQIAKTGAKLLICMGMAALFCWHPVKRMSWFLRGSLHAGAIARFFGQKELVLYG